VSHDNSLDDCEAEANPTFPAATALFPAREASENALAFLHRNAGAIIFDDKNHLIVNRLEPDTNFTPGVARRIVK
jgi:hypothetical protein